ncbi:peptide MFS transporter [Simkania negevensis]|uniref:Peptide MFS transporter n=1 Tax=Simkania negevensis TaxID=83561 RepID=A0ABS3AV63_9BACT|nr:peptide MFS transporter [Simkania negevensis]
MTEMWERFSFYGMRALLVLYLIAQVGSGGLGWTYAEALSLYGTYLGAAWLTPLVGGVIADRWLGQRRSVILGGLLITTGHFMLALGQQLWAFYGSLTLIAIGVGFFKPCITAILGGLYKPNDRRRDSGYNIFYMGINVGGFIAVFICGWLQVTYGFHYGFAAAGVGMLLGMAIFLYGLRYFGEEGKKPARMNSKREKRPLNRGEKRAVAFIVILCLISVAFYTVYEQVGGLLVIYTQDYTNRNLFGFEIPTAWVQSIDPLTVLLTAPIISAIWVGFARRKKELSVVMKMGIGFALSGIGFLFMLGAAQQLNLGNGVQSSLFWIIGCTVCQTLGEICTVPVIWSAVSRLSPKHLISTLMAISLGAGGFGSKFAGMVGGYVEKLGPLQLFATISVTMFAFAILMAVADKKLTALSEEQIEVTAG